MTALNGVLRFTVGFIYGVAVAEAFAPLVAVAAVVVWFALMAVDGWRR